ncbi:MAG: hypothetical protein U0893_23820 [Chloroflexota bacterium]
MEPTGPTGARRRRWRTTLAGAALTAVVALFPAAPATPSYAGSPADAPAQAARDLGAPRAEGVTLMDSFASFSQANAYTFQVPDGSSTVQVYVGDLWYDVEVLLLKASGLPSDAGQWRSVGCNNAAGCVTSAPPSARRRVQFFQPKGIIETVEPGSYAVLVRPRNEDAFDASRRFTLRVIVTAPVCSVNADAEKRYQLALAMTPSKPGPFDLVTMTAYVSPPFEDLFEFSWSVDGRGIGASGSIAQMPALEIGRGGSHEVRVTARGARAYPDPDQPDVPPTLMASCSISVN